MEEEILLCPHIENCVLYKNLLERGRDDRLGVIIPKKNGYDCLALIATQDPPSEGGVPIDKDLQKRLPENNRTMNYQCSHIKMLNLETDILRRLKQSG